MRKITGENNPNWKGGLVEITCVHCSSVFIVKPARAEKAKYCSIQCCNKHKAITSPNLGRKSGSCPSNHKNSYVTCIPVDIVERIQLKTSIAPSGCIEWSGRRNKDGYGLITMGKKQWLAHRLVWLIKHGLIPENINVLHHCDNPKCVNICHLFIGTQADNVEDMLRKGRHKAIGRSGEKNSMAKLSDEQVDHIKKVLQSDGKRRGLITDLACKYGVSISTISQIRSGNRRKI